MLAKYKNLCHTELVKIVKLTFIVFLGIFLAGCSGSNIFNFSSSEGKLFKVARNDTTGLNDITISGTVAYKDPDGQCWIFKLDPKDDLYSKYAEITLEVPKKLESAISANAKLKLKGIVVSEDSYSIACPETVFAVSEVL